MNTDCFFRWGCSHEADAITAYKQFLSAKGHINVEIEEAGLFLSDSVFYLGATPDALVNCDCCGMGIAEVKCPYCKRDSFLEDAAKDKNFCLQTHDGLTSLKTDHQYYYQVQCQLYVTKKSYCDFVVYTSPEYTTCQIFVERHTLNEQFMERCIRICKLFYIHCVLPELVGKFFTR